jgi:hypothetical protein
MAICEAVRLQNRKKEENREIRLPKGWRVKKGAQMTARQRIK